jgi:predicted N-acetyltransferase YhbS
MQPAISNQQISFRRGSLKDAPECGRICYEAFKNIAERHGFPPDFPSAEVTTELLSFLLGHPKFYSVVAEKNGRIIGSNFLDERSIIAGVGPITVDPTEQNKGVGKKLMQNVLSRAGQGKFPGVRLVQAAYHGRSLSLYTKLGFVTRETLSVMQGHPINESIQGYLVREAAKSDLKECNKICFAVHGFDRSSELEDSISQKSALVVERNDSISGYSTGLAFFGHTVAETNVDMMAMIGSRREYQGPGILVPTRNYELFCWCLKHGLRVVEQMTFMTIGLYNEPAGSYLPSILY